MRPSHVFAALCTIALCTLGAPAQAQDVAAAKRMFEQGVADMEAGNLDKACPALEASYKGDPRPGTLFTLAECENKRGRLATAMARYDNYLSMYPQLTPDQQRKQGDRLKRAKDQKAALAPQVPELTLVLPPSAPKDTVVKRDGTEIAAAVLGVALPLDPGEHLVTTQAPGGEVTELRVTVGKGEKKQVTLQVKAAPPRAASKAGEALGTSRVPSADVAPEPRSRVPAIVMGAGALTIVGVGVGLFVASEGKRADAFKLVDQIEQRNGSCVILPIDTSCDPAISLARQSDTLHNIAVGAFIGAGVLAAGTLTYLLLPPPKVKKVIQSAMIRVTPVFGGDQGGMVVSGGF